MCVLGLDKGPDELVCGLCVEGQGVVQRLQVRALLQEGLLQTHSPRMEVLLRRSTRKGTSCLHVQRNVLSIRL